VEKIEAAMTEPGEVSRLVRHLRGTLFVPKGSQPTR
jgi:hypothetical protein